MKCDLPNATAKCAGGKCAVAGCAKDAVGKADKPRVQLHSFALHDGVGFSVEDNGHGFDETVRQQIFTPYFTTRTEGTGLGLAICHRIVTDHGGTITLEPAREGEGAAFAIRLSKWSPVGLR